MPMSDKHWREVTPSPHAHEREALAFLRSRLPDHEPWRVWTNFLFVADDGTMNEVDALVLSPVGLFLVEIKSHPGVVRGNQSTLTFETASFKKHIDHPRRLTNLKAKRLKSWLVRTARGTRSNLEIPRVEELVFLSHATGSELRGPEAAHVTFRDASIGGAGVIEALTQREGAQLEGGRRTRLDKPIAKWISNLLENAGIARKRTQARIGDYQITGRLEDGASFDDFRGHHVNVPEVPYRIRRYYVPRGTDEERERYYQSARREYRLLSRLNHPGILGVRGMPSDEYGPALVYEHDDAWMRLDRYLEEHGDRLSSTKRLGLLRSLAEPLAYAHEQGVVHRALSPQAVLVQLARDDSPAGVKLMNWSTGSLATDGTTVGATLMRGTLHVGDYQDEPELVFLAPELRREPGKRDWTLDVFSLGAIAYQVFSGTPPASDPNELAERVRDHGLDLSAALDAAPAALSKLIARATDADVGARFQSVQDFLERLDFVIEEIDRPETEVDDPREAQKGSTFRDGTRVVHRLGSGATAIAFLVERDGDASTDAFVLKVAREVDKNERLVREANVLRNLDHPHVARFSGDIEVGAYRGFLARPASTETLRSRLRQETSLHVELLERFGDQLLDVLGYLEARGINHRDIKPDNIAVSDLDKKAPLSLVLFDFSLSDEPLENIDVGTPQYADPFLADRRPKRWDLQAERYSAAVTLYEMATGALPRWGDGQSDPRLTHCEIALDGDRLPSGFRPQLLAFFERALARDPRARFDNAEAMRDAWSKAFQAAENVETARSTQAAEAGPTSLADEVRALGKKTPLTDLTLSTRARNALDRLELFTVEALLAARPSDVFGARGVGQKTRNELQETVRELRRLFPDVEIGSPLAVDEATVAEGTDTESAVSADVSSGDEPRTAAGSTSTAAAPENTERSTPLVVPATLADTQDSIPRDVDGVLARVLVGQGRDPERSRTILENVFGLRDDLATALTFPNQSRAAERLGLNPGTISQELARFRETWLADDALRSVRDDLARFAERNGGLAAPRELAETLLVERGSHAKTRDEQLHVATALARAATEAEAGHLSDDDDPPPRWTLRRRDGTAWLAESDAHVHWGAALLQRARQLAQSDPILGRDAVEAGLLAVARPDGVEAVPAARLARLVAAAAPDELDLSARGELYPVPLPADRALSLSLGALTGAGQRHRLARRDPQQFGAVRVIDAEEIQERVRSRYPRSEPLPARPALDELLAAAGWAGRWDERERAFVLKAGDAPSVESRDGSSFRTRTVIAPIPELAPDVTQARRFADELGEIVANRHFAVLKAPLLGVARTVELLRRAEPRLEPFDLDARFIEILDELLAAGRVDSERFYAADAEGPADGRGWSRVLRIVDDVVERLEAELAEGDTPLCIRNVGLLARYDRWQPLERLNGLAGGSGGRAAIVVIPGDVSDTTFALFDRAIPALPNQRQVVPRPWLDGQHLQAG